MNILWCQCDQGHLIGIHPDDAPDYLTAKSAKLLAGSYPLIFSTDCPACRDKVAKPQLACGDAALGDFWLTNPEFLTASELQAEGFDAVGMFAAIDNFLSREMPLQAQEYFTRSY